MTAAPDIPEPSARRSIGGKYAVLNELGQGGMGVVLRARHEGLNKLVAIKVLQAALLIDKTSRSRFELEAQAGARLSHPNLVSVFDYGFTEANEPYLVMEYVEGISLQQFMKEPNRRVDDALDILIQVGKALRYLHEQNIVHRDLKTSNILVQEISGERYGRLLDLGIAKVLSSQDTNAQLTNTGAIFGSPAYMSPEQCQGQQIDARSDIYSFGCVLYECITSEVPFTADNPLGVMLQHLSGEPKAIECNRQREFELSQVVTKCMAKDPAHRFQSVKDLIDELERIKAIPANQKFGRNDSRSRTHERVQTEKAGSNNRKMAALLCLTALVAVAVTALFTHFSKLDLNTITRAAAAAFGTLSPEELALYHQKAAALARQSEERRKLTVESIRSFDQATQNLREGSEALRRYNDRMEAQRNQR